MLGFRECPGIARNLVLTLEPNEVEVNRVKNNFDARVGPANAMDERSCHAGPADNRGRNVFVPEETPILDRVGCFDACFPESSFIVGTLWPVERHKDDLTPFSQRLEYEEHSQAAGIAVGTGNAFVEDNDSRPVSLAIVGFPYLLQ